MGHDLHVGIDTGEPFLRGFELRPPDVSGGKEDLALQIRIIHDVEVYEADCADARRREVERERRAQASRADREHPCGLQLLLPLHAHLRHDQVARIAADLLVGERRLRRSTRDRGNDGQRVALRERRRVLQEVAHVLVVLVDIDEGAQPPGVVVEVLAETRVARDETLERVGDRGA